MRRVVNAAVQRLVARIELVAVAEPKRREVELCHCREIAVATDIHPHAERTLNEHQRRNLCLRTQALRISHQ